NRDRAQIRAQLPARRAGQPAGRRQAQGFGNIAKSFANRRKEKDCQRSSSVLTPGSLKPSEKELSPSIEQQSCAIYRRRTKLTNLANTYRSVKPARLS